MNDDKISAARLSGDGRARLLASAALAVLAVAAAPHHALAQAATPATTSAEAAGVAEVVVTGSRIVSGANAPTPVTVVSTQQLLNTTPTNIADGLNKLPIFLGSNSERNASSGGGNTS